MIWERMSRKDARDIFCKMEEDKAYRTEHMAFMNNPVIEDTTYSEIHNKLKQKYDQCESKKNAKEYSEMRSWEYGIDLDMAEEIYRVFLSYGMTLRDASDPEVWIYISMNVIPDIIIRRFRKVGKPIPHEDRFFNNSRRVYPSMLWWYFHIAYQSTEGDSIQDTKKLLMNNQSDDISQLLERAGKEGYPIEIYKQIMVEYARRLENDRTNSDGLLSRALMLNSVQMETMEPELMYDGLESYVSNIFDQVM